MKRAGYVFVISILSVFLIFGTNAFAVSIDVQVFSATDSASITAWKAALGGPDILLEDFEGEDRDWYQSLDLASGLGTFTAGGDIGTGRSSYNQLVDSNNTDPYFRISNQNIYGRTGGDNFLDSADITELTLDFEMSLTNIWFYIQDPSDQRGTITTATGTTSLLASDSELWEAPQDNSDRFFVGISVQDDVLGQIVWDVSGGSNYDNDGYGLDDFHTVAPVPEPGTMLLLGAGLIGIAGFGRKKFIKK